MKNSIISIILFISLCVFISWSNKNVVTLLEYISNSCIEIETEIKSNNIDKAKQLANELYSKLEVKDIIPSIYLNHTEYDALSDEATKIYIYINKDEIPDTLSSIRLLKNNSENIRELQKFTLKNIF